MLLSREPGLCWRCELFPLVGMISTVESKVLLIESRWSVGFRSLLNYRLFCLFNFGFCQKLLLSLIAYREAATLVRHLGKRLKLDLGLFFWGLGVGPIRRLGNFLNFAVQNVGAPLHIDFFHFIAVEILHLGWILHNLSVSPSFERGLPQHSFLRLKWHDVALSHIETLYHELGHHLIFISQAGKTLGQLLLNFGVHVGVPLLLIYIINCHDAVPHNVRRMPLEIRLRYFESMTRHWVS